MEKKQLENGMKAQQEQNTSNGLGTVFEKS